MQQRKYLGVDPDAFKQKKIGSLLLSHTVKCFHMTKKFESKSKTVISETYRKIITQHQKSSSSSVGINVGATIKGVPVTAGLQSSNSNSVNSLEHDEGYDKQQHEQSSVSSAEYTANTWQLVVEVNRFIKIGAGATKTITSDFEIRHYEGEPSESQKKKGS